MCFRCGSVPSAHHHPVRAVRILDQQQQPRPHAAGWYSYLRTVAVARVCAGPLILFRHRISEWRPALRIVPVSFCWPPSPHSEWARTKIRLIDTGAESFVHAFYVFLVPTATAAVFIFGGVDRAAVGCFRILCQPAPDLPNHKRRPALDERWDWATCCSKFRWD